MSTRITATRYHDICAGHRVYGHESKCQHLHGHNYRFHFTVEADHLDVVGRVVDFSVIKSHLCEWLENKWDHHFLVWEKDPLSRYLLDIDPTVVLVPFNPTAENLANHMVTVVGPEVFDGTGVQLVECRIDETAKCSATCSLPKGDTVNYSGSTTAQIELDI